jgi:hypothetical protein
MVTKAVLMQPKDYGTAIQVSPLPCRFSDVLLTWQFCTILNTAFYSGARPSTLFRIPAYHSPLKIKHVWIQRVGENETMLGFSVLLSLTGCVSARPAVRYASTDEQLHKLEGSQNGSSYLLIVNVGTVSQRGNLLFDLGSLIVAHLFQFGAWQGPVKCPVVQRDCIKHWRDYDRLLIGVYRLPARVTFAKFANKVDKLST